MRVQGCLLAGALAAAVMLSPLTPQASAFGLESLDYPPTATPGPSETRDAIAAKERAVEDTFQNSDSLKGLLEKSDANKAKNAKAIRDKYCYRQAEMGVGDCGGLRYIPGMTKNGVQKRPSWLDNLLGIESQTSPVPEGQTLDDMFDAAARS